MINIEIVFFIIFSILLCIIILYISSLLGGSSRGRNKNVPFESGISSTGSVYIKFSAQFYLIAVFFVIFDVESIYLYAWSVCIRNVGWQGFIEAILFIITLLISLIYLIRLNFLKWSAYKK